MPSFLSKVFGRKKDDVRSSNGSLLDGKFEAVAAEPKSPVKNAPQLSLNLPATKEAPTFEQKETPDLRGRRLDVAETLQLVQACSAAIQAHGLETLGLMRPNWHSSSPANQKKLITRFLSQSSDFATDIDQSSPHDVAAVLRWALRHLKLESASFGKSEDWYKKFHDSEKQSNYPPRAYSDTLLPLIPDTHVKLLTVVLDLTASLSAHSEASGVSGSKFSKLVGLWLLTSRRVEPHESWSNFYSRWASTGRILEHLFLSRIRDESSRLTLPRRLTELVSAYPYTKSGTLSTFVSEDENYLPRPRFSTRLHEALFVRVESESSTPTKEKALTPVKVLTTAFSASSTPGEWDQIKEFAKADTDGEKTPTNGTAAPRYNYGKVLADETLDILQLRSSSAPPVQSMSPAFSFLSSPEANGGTKPRSFSVSSTAVTPSISKESSTTNDADPASSNHLGLDWTQFSTSGFFGSDSPGSGSKLAATLLDKDVEVTSSKVGLTKSASKKGRKSYERKSYEGSRATSPTLGSVGGTSFAQTPTPTGKAVIEPPVEGKVAKTERVYLDEAFIDFWSDALADPNSIEDWPSFVLAKLSPAAIPVSTPGDDHKPIEYLVIEHAYVAPPPPPAAATPRPSSPKPSETSTLASASVSKKRFSLFSSPSSLSTKRRGSKKDGKDSGAKIGEMGEILEDGSEDKKEKTEKKKKEKKEKVQDKEVITKEDNKEKEGKFVENLKVTPSPEASKDKELGGESGKKEDDDPASGAIATGAGAAAAAVGAGAGAGAIAIINDGEEKKEDEKDSVEPAETGVESVDVSVPSPSQGEKEAASALDETAHAQDAVEEPKQDSELPSSATDPAPAVTAETAADPPTTSIPAVEAPSQIQETTSDDTEEPTPIPAPRVPSPVPAEAPSEDVQVPSQVVEPLVAQDVPSAPAAVADEITELSADDTSAPTEETATTEAPDVPADAREVEPTAGNTTTAIPPVEIQAPAEEAITTGTESAPTVEEALLDQEEIKAPTPDPLAPETGLQAPASLENAAVETPDAIETPAAEEEPQLPASQPASYDDTQIEAEPTEAVEEPVVEDVSEAKAPSSESEVAVTEPEEIVEEPVIEEVQEPEAPSSQPDPAPSEPENPVEQLPLQETPLLAKTPSSEPVLAEPEEPVAEASSAAAPVEEEAPKEERPAFITQSEEVVSASNETDPSQEGPAVAAPSKTEEVESSNVQPEHLSDEAPHEAEEVPEEPAAPISPVVKVVPLEDASERSHSESAVASEPVTNESLERSADHTVEQEASVPGTAFSEDTTDPASTEPSATIAEESHEGNQDVNAHHEPLREPSPGLAETGEITEVPVVEATTPLVEDAAPLPATPSGGETTTHDQGPQLSSGTPEVAEVLESGATPAAHVLLDAEGTSQPEAEKDEDQVPKVSESLDESK